MRPGAVVSKRCVALGDHLAKTLTLKTFDPLICLLRMACDSIEESPEKLRCAQPHIFKCLVNKEFVQRQLVGRNVLEASCMRLEARLDLFGWTHI